MPLTITCTSCHSKLKVPDNLPGKKVKCPQCAAVIGVPADLADVSAVTPEAPSPALPSAAEPLPEKDEGRARPVRRRRPRAEDFDDEERRTGGDDLAEAASVLIPYRNSKALIAYYCGVFGLIPCVGAVLGPVALIFGILGLRYRRRNPAAHGTGHAIAGIVLGSLEILGNIVAPLVLLAIGLISGSMR